jgi:hypothetical protein
MCWNTRTLSSVTLSFHKKMSQLSRKEY